MMFCALCSAGMPCVLQQSCLESSCAYVACGLKEDHGRRTSSRHRMKPLRWFEGESKTYERRFTSALPALMLQAG